MRIIKPSSLKYGDTLGVIACSTSMSATTEETIQRAYGFLRGKGFKIIEAPNCRQTVGHTAGSIKDRAKALNDFFKNPKIDGILNFWGGYQSHQLLEYLDFEMIKKNPKPFIGFSDSTALQVGLYSQAGLVTFSGPAGITFGKPIVPEFTWDHFVKVLIAPQVPLALGQSSTFSENPWWREPSKEMIFKVNEGWKIFKGGSASGRLIGGNVGTMLLLAGTKYWPKLDGAILFLEDDEVESSRTIDRLFTQLRQMGVYEKISGVITGRFHGDVKWREDDSFEMVLRDSLKGYRFPVITGVDFGHTDPLVTLPLGIKCEINTRKPSITLLEKGVG